ncbi:hypothetical protein KIPB_014170, partial [Kipferlia bialata]
HQARHLTVFLKDPAALPDGIGLGIYFRYVSTADQGQCNQNDFQYLGAVLGIKPSATFSECRL